MDISSIVRWGHLLKSFVLKQRNKYRVTSYILRSGRRPWCYGYTEYKEQYLQDVINDVDVMKGFKKGNQLPAGYGFRLDERVLEIPWVLARLMDQGGRLLDAGSSLNHGYVLKSDALVKYKITIITLAFEGTAFPEIGISYVFGDLRNMEFRNDWFDAITCISTIEHIGMDNSMYIMNATSSTISGRVDVDNPKDNNGFIQAISELRRVLKPGGTLYITFPFGRYENHGFFQQFDTQLTDILINNFVPTDVKENVFRYDPTGWVMSDRDACGQCEYFDVHKSKYFDRRSKIEYPSDYTAGVRAVVCLELKK